MLTQCTGCGNYIRPFSGKVILGKPYHSQDCFIRGGMWYDLQRVRQEEQVRILLNLVPNKPLVQQQV